MDEYVVPAPVRLDKAKAFLGVKPFHCSGSHHLSSAGVPDAPHLNTNGGFIALDTFC